MFACFRILASDSDDGDADAVAPYVEREVEAAVAGQEVRIGRRSDVELPLPFAALSALHARLTREESGWFVEDVGSTNGTWLGGQKLAAGERQPLAPGAELRLGNVQLRFEGERAQEGGGAGPTEGTATIARRLVTDLFADSAQGGPTLQVSRGAPPRRLPLTKLGVPYVVGRAETCALPLGVEEVSREHATFVRDAAGVVVRDLGSKNGVVISGQRIVGQRRLSDGDVVEIGPVVLAFADPVDRYLRELEATPVDAAPTVALAPAAASGPTAASPPAAASAVASASARAAASSPAPVSADTLESRAPSLSLRPPASIARASLAVGVAVLLLLALAAAAILF